MTEQKPDGSPPPETRPKPDATPIQERRVIVRPWPKVIFLYPTLLTAVICWLILLIGGDPAAATPGEAGEAVTPPADSNVGNAFMTVFFLNMLVFSFDFSRIKSITILITIVALGFGIAWANSHWNVVGGIEGALDKVDIQMNAQFYAWTAAFFFVCFLLVLINTRFNYYEINHREILHHHGYLGDITRVPTQGLRFNKEIYDLMEYALLRSGRLIFVTPTSHEAIVIDNVIGVNKVEDLIKDLLSVVAVRMH